jgi:hypothetical protein
MPAQMTQATLAAIIAQVGTMQQTLIQILERMTRLEAKAGQPRPPNPY